MATSTTYHSLTKPEDTDFADNDPLNTNFDKIDAAMSDIGDIKMTARSTAPGANWMICDGSEISRSTYADLFTAIGTAFGVGNGTTTFNIPDLRGKFALGDSASYTLGATGGEDEVTLLTSDMPSHTHGIDHDHASFNTASAGTHNHDVFFEQASNRSGASGTLASVTNIENTAPTGGGANYNAQTNSNGGNDGSHLHAIDVPSFTGDSQSEGLDMPHNNMPPYQVVNYLIRVL